MKQDNSVQVISVCNLQHLNVWKLTSRLVPVCIKANEYVVYVPAKEVQIFEKFTNPIVKVLSQEGLDCGYSDVLWDRIKKTKNRNRFGWYLQQFHKIQALYTAESESSIIWDADCVPTRRVHFFNERNQPFFMKASELHAEYFVAIDKLLGMKRVQEHSFVVPGFPVHTSWVKEMINSILQTNTDLNWYEAIIESVNLDSPSGFSETETLGTWIANSYPSDWMWKELKWERLGRSRFDDAKNLNPIEIMKLGLTHDLDIISFENWDLRGMPAKVNGFKILMNSFFNKHK